MNRRADSSLSLSEDPSDPLSAQLVAEQSEETTPPSSPERQTRSTASLDQRVRQLRLSHISDNRFTLGGIVRGAIGATLALGLIAGMVAAPYYLYTAATAKKKGAGGQSLFFRRLQYAKQPRTACCYQFPAISADRYPKHFSRQLRRAPRSRCRASPNQRSLSNPRDTSFRPIKYSSAQRSAG